MSTPTPRTDAVEERNGNVLCSSANLEFARTLERELAIELERATHYRDEWQKERAKVKTLRSACESICEEWGRNHEAPFYAGSEMERLASNALEKMENET